MPNSALQPAHVVERLPTAISQSPITDELGRIFAALQQSIPDAAQISFDFDGKLHVHIDVRRREQIMLIEAMLPALCGGGRFHTINLGKTPHHPFMHRISAMVNG